MDHTPDYEEPRLREALTNFIHELGWRYDGDPRLGVVGLGLLGTWGEWHNSPHDEWSASKTVQREVMDAYEAAFKKAKLVARYPAGTNDLRYAENGRRPIGYHDDSFAWATVHTGKPGDAWFFETRLRSAGALDKWRTQPVGSEVRPEVWSCLFTDPSCAPIGQEFARCVAVTHAAAERFPATFCQARPGPIEARLVDAGRVPPIVIRRGPQTNLRRRFPADGRLNCQIHPNLRSTAQPGLTQPNADPIPFKRSLEGRGF